MLSMIIGRRDGIAVASRLLKYKSTLFQAFIMSATVMTATAQQLEFIKDSIKTIPDYPKPGILFRDVTSLLENPAAYQASIDLLTARFRDTGVTKVVGTEARGFLFGAPVALALGVGFVPVRKPGKLPRETISEEYELEYGTDKLEIHTDAIKPGDKVLVIDDLLATGGTIEATAKLIRRLGGEVSDAAFIINLPELGGEKRLNGLDITCYSLVCFSGH
jgi:adenine phosphoribosyltransferase